jgi:subtilisin family serine protease
VSSGGAKMKFKKSIIGLVVSIAITSGLATANANEYQKLDRNALLLESKGVVGSVPAKTNKSEPAPYIVQLNGGSGVNHAERIGELTSSNPGAVQANNSYNSVSPRMAAYTAAMKAKQEKVAQAISGIEIVHNFVHTFNGFSAVLTNAQVNALRNHPDVVAVHDDEIQKPATSNTPEFLGLNSGEGQHVNGLLGEGVIVGVVDSGIAPDNLSFTDPDFLYGDPADLGWNGVCNVGDVPVRDESFGAEFDGADPDFSCNNKLIGARFFGGTFDAVYGIQTDLGEFLSARDADGHGSHTAGTAAGNAGVPAKISGNDVGTISGIAPRARVAAYKVCWNSGYVSPAGNSEAGCFPSDSMASIDAAVADGVDVINYSISGSRTSLVGAVPIAMLNAAEAGVFVAVSAGNSGPTSVTVGTPAPWITSVAASTYDGTSAVNAMEVSYSGTPADNIVFVEGVITAPLSTTGDVAGSLVLAEPLLGCFEAGESSPLDNAAEIDGNIALISRGTCAFSEKVARAQDSGATAVVIYTAGGRPVTALGGDGSFDIPGGMISELDGGVLNAALTEGADISVRLSSSIFGEQVEQGNLIAGFSSRGPNGSTLDIIKPDITAPGVRILAATTDTLFQGVQGETQAYLSGTSMSSPHIAGMAALLVQEHPTWTPAQIKSALMTSARQNLTRQEDDGVAADPFDFGSGHAVPPSARTPGLTYNATIDDYLGLLCGLGEDAAVISQSGLSCADVATTISTDPSQLNYPSIAIGELSESETVFRTVTDVSGINSSYSYTIEAPAGISATVVIENSDDNNILEVTANSTASYAITFEVTENTVFNEWAFGAITFTGDNGIEVRSPIAIFPVPEISINVPESISTSLRRGRASFPVEMLYSGTTSLDYAGLEAPFSFGNETVQQDPDQSFELFEAGTAIYGYNLPDTKVLRVSLLEELVDVEGTDLDLYLHYRAPGEPDVLVGTSARGGSNEDIILSDVPAGLYIVSVHGWFVPGPEPVEGEEPVLATANVTPLNWVAVGAQSSTRISGSRRAIDGRFNNIRITTRGLEPGTLYMGGVTFFNEEGEAQGTTVLEVQP